MIMIMICSFGQRCLNTTLTDSKLSSLRKGAAKNYEKTSYLFGLLNEALGNVIFIGCLNAG
jgi:hypothetical protein